MTDRKTLIFHIGDHKTGTTSIQYTFARKLVTLEGEKICYPARLAHNHLLGAAKSLEGSGPARRKAVQQFEKLAARIRKSRADCVLISAESLESLPPEQLRSIIGTYFRDCADDIRVIAYMRPHAARVLSSYATQTKSGLFTGSGPAEFHRSQLEKGRLLCHPRFTAWRTAFGEAFILRPFIRQQLHRGDVVHDLVRHGFGRKRFSVASGPAANESLALDDLMRLKFLQGRLQHLPQKLRHALGWEFMRIASVLPPPETCVRPALHQSLARKIQADYLEDARTMDRDFFDGAPLMEQELAKSVHNALPEPQNTDPGSYFPAGTQRGLAALSELTAGMMAREEEAQWVPFLRARRMPGQDSSTEDTQ